MTNKNTRNALLTNAITARLATAGVAALLLTGCAKKDSADTALRADSAALTAAVTADSVKVDSNLAAVGMSDANILYMLDQANIADSTEGVIAANKGSSSAVRDFGKSMMKDHHDLRQDGQNLGAKFSIVPAAPPSNSGKSEAADALAALESTPKGPAWDKLYIDAEVADHQKALLNLTAALATTSNQELKDLINKATPVVQKHLDKALELQKKMPGM